MLANTKLRHLHRLDICVCFANQLLLIANQFEIVEQKMLIVLNSLFSPLLHSADAYSKCFMSLCNTVLNKVDDVING